MVFGIGLGLIAAVFCSFTKLWNTNYKRSFILVASGALHVHALLSLCCVFFTRAPVPAAATFVPSSVFSSNQAHHLSVRDSDHGSRNNEWA